MKSLRSKVGRAQLVKQQMGCILGSEPRTLRPGLYSLLHTTLCKEFFRSQIDLGLHLSSTSCRWLYALKHIFVLILIPHLLHGASNCNYCDGSSLRYPFNAPLPQSPSVVLGTEP